MKYRTNINCSSCVNTVTPHLDNLEGVKKWEVNTANKDKILTVEGDVTDEQVMAAVKEAGFNAEPKKDGFLKNIF